MGSSGIKRSTAMIVAVLGGQTLALSIMLGAAWMLSAVGNSAARPLSISTADCEIAVVSEAPAGIKSQQLLNLSVGWLR